MQAAKCLASSPKATTEQDSTPSILSPTGICLNEEVYISLAEARAVIKCWWRDYNQMRPHSAHGGLTPGAAGAAMNNQDSHSHCGTVGEQVTAKKLMNALADWCRQKQLGARVLQLGY
jgi:hypothetical protein